MGRFYFCKINVFCQLSFVILGIIFGSVQAAESGGLYPLGETTETSRLSDKPIGLLPPSATGQRPRLITELGDPFLETGNLFGGFELPTGAIWQPRLWTFGILRTALQVFDDGVNDQQYQWANRLDLYANLQLTGTEKIIVGVRPLDKNSLSNFTRVGFKPDSDNGFQDEFNADIRTLFFEGDFGSLFPNLDPEGFRPIDYGFAVGRQTLQFQEGILINDDVDSLGIVRNNIRLPGVSNLRMTGVWGWHHLDRNDNRNNAANMFGLFNSADTHVSTFNLDMIYVNDELPNSDGFYIGGSAIQRIGHFNTSFRINSSFALEDETLQVGDGTLFSSEVSWTPQSSDDIAYVNAFAAVGNFTQAGREPIIGGPLGAFGILFASPNIGDFLSELNSFANDVVGYAIGYQAFWENHRRNLTLEAGGRVDIDGNRNDDFAFGFQFQQRLAHRVQLQIDGHYAIQENRDNGFGARSEIFIQF